MMTAWLAGLAQCVAMSLQIAQFFRFGTSHIYGGFLRQQNLLQDNERTGGFEYETMLRSFLSF